ncbi:MAG TPA: nucleotide exchange factor GrpE [Stellaceae bacterium]|jgi:molecular chaperone GrpE|nr:nucleotide exchange factor GrpE [Stellaceae bacterium]
MDDKDESAMPANDAAAESKETTAPEAAIGPEPPEARIAALEAEVAEHKDRALRALAEAENVRRRTERERADALKFAISGFARDLLGAADNLRRALDSMPAEEAKDDKIRGLLEGVAATERELLAAFERNGLKRIDPKGEKFDHNLHQAIFEAENSGQPAGTVVEVLQPGYVLNDRLLRPAMVGVAKGGAAGDPR